MNDFAIPSHSNLNTDQTWSTIATFIIAATAAIIAAEISQSRALRSANDRSRWCTVWTVVERGTYQIDELILEHKRWRTIDIVVYPEEGDRHFYSTKPPLLPTVIAGLYYVIKQTTGMTLLTHTNAVTRLILVMVNLIPWTIALGLLAGILKRYAENNVTRTLVLLTACLGTLILPFLCTLNNHTIAATALIIALYPAMVITIEGRKEWWLFAISGFFAAWTCTNELPAALLGFSLFILLLAHAPGRTLLVFLPAALVPLSAYFALNYLVTGGWKPFYAYYGTEIYNFGEFKGIKSHWNQPSGIDQGKDNTLTYFFHCTFGHHGIFSLSPVFLLSLIGWSFNTRRQKLKVFLWLGLMLTIVVLGFYLMRTDNYNYGGRSCALRWMLWIIPFWLLALIPVCERWQHSKSFRCIAALLLALSVFSAFEAYGNPWQHPWIFKMLTDAGLINYN